LRSACFRGEKKIGTKEIRERGNVETCRGSGGAVTHRYKLAKMVRGGCPWRERSVGEVVLKRKSDKVNYLNRKKV